MTRIRRLLELADHGLVQLVIGGGFIVASILAFVVTFTLLGISPREPIGNDRCTDRQDQGACHFLPSAEKSEGDCEPA